MGIRRWRPKDRSRWKADGRYLGRHVAVISGRACGWPWPSPPQKVVGKEWANGRRPLSLENGQYIAKQIEGETGLWSWQRQRVGC